MDHLLSLFISLDFCFLIINSESFWQLYTYSGTDHYNALVLEGKKKKSPWFLSSGLARYWRLSVQFYILHFFLFFRNVPQNFIYVMSDKFFHKEMRKTESLFLLYFCFISLKHFAYSVDTTRTSIFYTYLRFLEEAYTSIIKI